jgi:hypothetical protein
MVVNTHIPLPTGNFLTGSLANMSFSRNFLLLVFGYLDISQFVGWFIVWLVVIKQLSLVLLSVLYLISVT